MASCQNLEVTVCEKYILMYIWNWTSSSDVGSVTKGANVAAGIEPLSTPAMMLVWSLSSGPESVGSFFMKSAILAPHDFALLKS